MTKATSRFLLVSFISLLIFPNISFALAGISEQSFEYYYSPSILISFEAPSDFCPREQGDQNCILIYSAKQKEECSSCFNILDNLDRLTAVNFPQTAEPKFLIGKSYADGSWLIYDLKNSKKIFSDKNFDLVEQKWEFLGNSKPEFADVNNFEKYFHKETDESKRQNEESNRFAFGALVTFFTVFLAIVGLVFGILYWINRSSRKRL